MYIDFHSHFDFYKDDELKYIIQTNSKNTLKDTN